MLFVEILVLQKVHFLSCTSSHSLVTHPEGLSALRKSVKPEAKLNDSPQGCSIQTGDIHILVLSDINTVLVFSTGCPHIISCWNILHIFQTIDCKSCTFFSSLAGNVTYILKQLIRKNQHTIYVHKRAPPTLMTTLHCQLRDWHITPHNAILYGYQQVNKLWPDDRRLFDFNQRYYVF